MLLPLLTLDLLLSFDLVINELEVHVTLNNLLLQFLTRRLKIRELFGILLLLFLMCLLSLLPDRLYFILGYRVIDRAQSLGRGVARHLTLLVLILVDQLQLLLSNWAIYRLLQHIIFARADSSWRQEARGILTRARAQSTTQSPNRLFII